MDAELDTENIVRRLLCRNAAYQNLLKNDGQAISLPHATKIGALVGLADSQPVDRPALRRRERQGHTLALRIVTGWLGGEALPPRGDLNLGNRETRFL